MCRLAKEMNDLQQKYKPVAGFKCDFCSYKSSVEKTIKEHLLTHCEHEEIVMEFNGFGSLRYHCPICGAYVGYCRDDKINCTIKNIEDVIALHKVAVKMDGDGVFVKYLTGLIREHNKNMRKKK